MTEGMKSYYDYTISPLGRLFYKTTWKQLESVENKKILEFGSGFGFTSSFLAQKNELTAIEYYQDMIDVADKSQVYTQIQGGLEALQKIENESYDFVVCHLVFEFVDNPKEILEELIRILKKGGMISIIRHNRAARIIQAIVQEYDLKEAKRILSGEYPESNAFGDIKYYENDDVLAWAEATLYLKEVHGIRTLASLHSDEIQNSDNWVDDMFEVELELQKNSDFVKISYFNHLIMSKN